MSSLNAKLEPCPFCGSDAEVERRGTARASMIVACTHCGARVESGDVYGLTHHDQWAWNRRAATRQEAEATEGDADKIITSLYRRFKDWSKRGFGPDDVTWCEVKADVTDLIAALRKAEPAKPVAQLGAGSEHDLHNVLKSVLYHFGPEGAAKVTKDALTARPATPQEPAPASEGDGL